MHWKETTPGTGCPFSFWPRPDKSNKRHRTCYVTCVLGQNGPPSLWQVSSAAASQVQFPTQTSTSEVCWFEKLADFVTWIWQKMLLWITPGPGFKQLTERKAGRQWKQISPSIHRHRVSQPLVWAPVEPFLAPRCGRRAHKKKKLSTGNAQLCLESLNTVFWKIISCSCWLFKFGVVAN